MQEVLMNKILLILIWIVIGWGQNPITQENIQEAVNLWVSNSLFCDYDNHDYSAIWNAQNQSHGVYFVKFTTQKFTKTQKLMLLK